MNNKAIISLILSLTLILPNNQSNIEVSATSSYYDDVGIYFEVEDTDEEIVVCFTNNAHSNYSSVVNYVIESGREVWSQPSLSGVDEVVYLTSIFIPPIHFGSLDGDQIEVVPTSYYCYIADSDNPVITEVVTLQNNIESVIEVLSFMEDQAIKCGITSQSDRNNAIAGAIRAVHIKYSGINNIEYQHVCGELNENYINYINNDYSRHIRSIDYFSYFIESSYFNEGTQTTIGYTIDEEYCTSIQHFLVDPFSLGNIDLVHMFAVIDGVMPSTGRSGGLYSLYAHELDYVVSFMGDIQTGLVDIESLNRDQNPDDPDYIDYLNISSFSSFASLTNHCPMSDLIADIDGFSISKSYIGNLSLVSGIDNYYSLTFNRLLTFRSIVIQDELGFYADITLDNFKNCVIDFFGIQVTNNSYSYTNVYRYGLIPYNLLFTYLYVNGTPNGFTITEDDIVNVNLLAEILELFIGYIFEL